MKLVTDQWRASLGVRDSESCWFMEEIGTYMRCWESPGDLPLVIEIVVSFRRFAALHSRKDIKFLSLVEDHPVFPKNVCKNLLHLACSEYTSRLCLFFSIVYSVFQRCPTRDEILFLVGQSNCKKRSKFSKILKKIKNFQKNIKVIKLIIFLKVKNFLKISKF